MDATAYFLGMKIGRLSDEIPLSFPFFWFASTRGCAFAMSGRKEEEISLRECFYEVVYAAVVLVLSFNLLVNSPVVSTNKFSTKSVLACDLIALRMRLIIVKMDRMFFIR